MNCKFNTLPCHAQTPAHSASCRGSGVMRLFGDSPGKARPGLCAFFLQRMRFGKCDNLLDRRGVRAVFEISHIDAAMHRILFKRFEKGIRRDRAAHLFCQQLCDRQPPASDHKSCEMRYHPVPDSVPVFGSSAFSDFKDILLQTL